MTFTKFAPSEAQIRAELLATAREFERVTGMKAYKIGLQALNDGNFLARVEAGEDFKMRSYRRLMEYFEANWPQDTVPRAQ